jgi:hypothetical protein
VNSQGRPLSITINGQRFAVQQHPQAAVSSTATATLRPAVPTASPAPSTTNNTNNNNDANNNNPNINNRNRDPTWFSIIQKDDADSLKRMLKSGFDMSLV